MTYSWKTALLPLLLAVALAAPTNALAQSSSTNFKGKAGFYESTNTYFVVNFTCSSGVLSGNWTLEVNGDSHSGPLKSTSCALSGTGGVWSTSVSDGPVSSNPPAISGTVGLTLTNVTTGKTFVASTASNCGGTSPCAEGSFTNTTGVVPFDSSTASPASGYGYATLTLSVH